MRINSFRLAKFVVFDNNVFICECVHTVYMLLDM